MLAEMEQRQNAEELLRQSQKMETVGQLTGGIAHDFNNILQAVQANLELIRHRSEDAEKVKALASSGLQAVRKGAELSNKLLAFARRSQLKLESFYVADMVAGMQELFSRTLGPGINLRLDLDTDEIPVSTDRTQAELALLNLVLNARDAVGAAGTILVKTDRYEAPEGEHDLSPGVYVRLSVEDNGAGMPADVLSRAFEPFFTTKPVGQGTGLGLSQVYGLAKQTGGSVRIESEIGRGTRVRLFIPEARGMIGNSAANEREGQSVVSLPHVHVLLVDDDERVRSATAQALEAIGLSVDRRPDPRAALKVETCPDIAILDYAMPETNGAELAQALRKRWPKLPIVFVTGYADYQELERVLTPNEFVLRKPYRMEDLQRHIVAALAT